MPPSAPSQVTAISVVGVEARPIFTTSRPMAIRVPHTSLSTILPDRRASRPTTILRACPSLERLINSAYAAVKRTISTPPRPSPERPPIVPRIPEIDFISDISIPVYSISHLQEKVCTTTAPTGTWLP